MRWLFFALLGLGFILASAACGHSRQAAGATPVEFRTTDGIGLHGDSYGSGGRWVVLVNDQGQDSRAWESVVQELLGDGYRVLTFDLRGYGDSGGDPSEGKAPVDVSAALAFARSRGARSLFLVGAGGGATAALVAAGSEDIDAIVVFSPRAELAGVAKDRIRDTRAPKLVVVGWLDYRAAEEATSVYTRVIGWKLFLSLPVEVEGTDLLASALGPQARGHLLQFLRSY